MYIHVNKIVANLLAGGLLMKKIENKIRTPNTESVKTMTTSSITAQKFKARRSQPTIIDINVMAHGIFNFLSQYRVQTSQLLQQILVAQLPLAGDLRLVGQTNQFYS